MFESFQSDAAHPAWTLGIVVGLPLALLVLTEAVVRLRRRGHPAEAPLREVRNLLVPALAAYVLRVHVAEFALQPPRQRRLRPAVAVQGAPHHAERQNLLN